MVNLLSAVRDRRAEKDKGFSLIELLVVVAILAILAAIAIPTFLNQRQKAYKGQSTSDANTIAKELATDSVWTSVTNTGTAVGTITFNSTTDVLTVNMTAPTPSTAATITISNVNITMPTTGTQTIGYIAAGTTMTGGGVVTNNDATHGWCFAATNNGQAVAYGATSVAGQTVMPSLQPNKTCNNTGLMS